jgi:hypothetical protein
MATTSIGSSNTVISQHLPNRARVRPGDIGQASGRVDYALGDGRQVGLGSGQ